MNHITIELCKEDRQRLDEVIAFLGLLVGEKYSTPQDAAKAFEEANAPVAPEPVGISKKENVEPAVNYTKDDVQALVIKLAAPGTGKKDAARAIVYEYAKKVSDIPDEKLNEVMAKLNKLAEED